MSLLLCLVLPYGGSTPFCACLALLPFGAHGTDGGCLATFFWRAMYSKYVCQMFSSVFEDESADLIGRLNVFTGRHTPTRPMQPPALWRLPSDSIGFSLVPPFGVFGAVAFEPLKVRCPCFVHLCARNVLRADAS